MHRQQHFSSFTPIHHLLNPLNKSSIHLLNATGVACRQPQHTVTACQVGCRAPSATMNEQDQNQVLERPKLISGVHQNVQNKQICTTVSLLTVALFAFFTAVFCMHISVNNRIFGLPEVHCCRQQQCDTVVLTLLVSILQQHTRLCRHKKQSVSPNPMNVGHPPCVLTRTHTGWVSDQLQPLLQGTAAFARLHADLTCGTTCCPVGSCSSLSSLASCITRAPCCVITAAGPVHKDCCRLSRDPAYDACGCTCTWKP